LQTYPTGCKIHQTFVYGDSDPSKSRIEGGLILNDQDILKGTEEKMIRSMSDRAVKVFQKLNSG
jgi:hypothetical protein